MLQFILNTLYKGIIMSEIKLIKFVSGEEVIASVESTDEQGSLVIKDAVTLVYRPQKDGQMSVGFAPFMPYSEGNLTIQSSAIGVLTKANQDLSNEYNRIFGSGIVVAPANDKILKA
jgi:small nuclear ribonucleoprotein (snRNP)-like protein